MSFKYKKLLTSILVTTITISPVAGFILPTSTQAAVPVKFYPVTVKYVDEQGAELRPSMTLNELNYVASNLYIPGYRSTEPSNYRGVADHSGIVVTYVYKKIAGGTITVKYVDQNGREIAPSTEINGDLDSPYTITPKNISGYTYVNSTGVPISWKFLEEPGEVKLIYKSNTVTTPWTAINTTGIFKIIMRFIDTSGNEIHPPSETDYDGTHNTMILPVIHGYAYSAALTGDTKPIVSEHIQSSTVIYLRTGQKLSDVQAKPVTINYVDLEGNKIARSDIFTGEIGERFHASLKKIRGYSYLMNSTDGIEPEGYITDQAQTVNIVYEKHYETVAEKPNHAITQIKYEYLDTKGNEIKPADIVEAEKPLKEYPEIFGYHLNPKLSKLKVGKEDKHEDIGKTVVEKNIEIKTLVYDNLSQPVTVNYVDINNHKVASSEVLTGKYQEAYHVLAKKVKGYTLLVHSSNFNGKFSDNPQNVTVVYEKETGATSTNKNTSQSVETLVYHFMDRQGKEIAPSVTVDADHPLKDFPTKVGYQLNQELSKIKNGVIKTGSIEKNVQTNTLIYDENIESNQAITAYSHVKTTNNMTVWTQPEKTNGANKVGALSSYEGKNLRILREAKTISGTYYLFSLDGKTIGWVDTKALTTFYTPSMEKNLTATRYVAPGQETQHYYGLPVADSAIDRGTLSKFAGQTLTVQREATIEGQLWYRVKDLGWTKAS
ncbi:GW domain-containing glycosaminoglycan-binding protein, partial [Listeria monocytogenes serotype 1/2a]|nr:GW domain-containing glycosaminoglycan-binding protein [Listeria monocytogenes serotype 1/2a]